MKTTKTKRNQSLARSSRKGAALILVILLLGLVFIAVAFSVDIARIQLTQVELQAGADAAARAGAEALARGVGGDDMAFIEAAIRDEVEMVATLNQAGGRQIDLNGLAQVEFGQTVSDAGGAPTFDLKSGLNMNTDCVRVTSSIYELPIVFGAFVGTESVSPEQVSAAMVQQRDMVVVLDKSTSMFERDAGTIPVTGYVDELRTLEEDLFDESDQWYDKSRFVEEDGEYKLTRRQALKLAVSQFRQEIDKSRGNEKLGLVSYGSTADDAMKAPKSPGQVKLKQGINSSIRNAMIGDKVAKGKIDGALLEDGTTDYANFDFNYIKMRYKGSTHIADGIEKGTSVLFGPGRRPFATPILIVMTDGRHNQASTPKAAATAAMSAHPNLRIYSIAFGAGAKKTAMQEIADVGRGKFYDAKNAAELSEAFIDLARTAGVTLIE